MRTALFGTCALAFALSLGASAQALTTRAVTLRAADGVRVYGWYREVRPGAPVVLMFHQAGSSHHEYDQIAPKLNDLGFSTLAIDQRSGGPMFGPNLTARAFHGEVPYVSALGDMQAAADWAARRHPEKIVAWGSSYSAALVFALAAHDDRIAAVIAFSPGEYLDDKHFVRTAAGMLTIPIFADSAADSDEVTQARTILDASPSQRKTRYVPYHGIHGSSTLLADRDPLGAAENWRAVSAFLRSFASFGTAAWRT